MQQQKINNKKREKRKRKRKETANKTCLLGTINMEQQMILVTLNNGLFQKKRQGG